MNAVNYPWALADEGRSHETTSSDPTIPLPPIDFSPGPSLQAVQAVFSDTRQ